MSAYLPTDGTITAIVRTGLRFGMGSLSSATLTGQALLFESIASVSYRYPRDLANGEHLPGQLLTSAPVVDWSMSGDNPAAFLSPSWYRYTPRGEDEPALDPGKVLHAIAAYTYQSCEHPGWATSPAKQFVDELKRRIQRRGYVADESLGTWTGELSAYHVDPDPAEAEAERLIESAFEE